MSSFFVTDQEAVGAMRPRGFSVARYVVLTAVLLVGRCMMQARKAFLKNADWLPVVVGCSDTPDELFKAIQLGTAALEEVVHGRKVSQTMAERLLCDCGSARSAIVGPTSASRVPPDLPHGSPPSPLTSSLLLNGV